MNPPQTSFHILCHWRTLLLMSIRIVLSWVVECVLNLWGGRESFLFNYLSIYPHLIHSLSSHLIPSTHSVSVNIKNALLNKTLNPHSILLLRMSLDSIPPQLCSIERITHVFLIFLWCFYFAIQWTATKKRFKEWHHNHRCIEPEHWILLPFASLEHRRRGNSTKHRMNVPPNCKIMNNRRSTRWIRECPSAAYYSKYKCARLPLFRDGQALRGESAVLLDLKIAIRLLSVVESGTVCRRAPLILLLELCTTCNYYKCRPSVMNLNDQASIGNNCMDIWSILSLFVLRMIALRTGIPLAIIQ